MAVYITSYYRLPRRLLLKQVGLGITLEGAQRRIWCSKIGWQTVPCPWSTDGEAALTGSSPGTRDQQSPRRRGTQLLETIHGVGRHTQVSQVRGCIVQALPHKHCRLVDDLLASEVVILELVKSKCLPILLYGLECCNLRSADLHSLDFTYNRLFMKVFRTKSIDVVKDCQYF